MLVMDSENNCMAKFLIDCKANIHQKSNGGITPLKYAIYFKKTEIIKYLIN